MTEIIVSAEAAERRALEAVLYNPKEASRLVGMLEEKDFSDAGFRLVFRTARGLAADHRPVNHHAVRWMLRSMARLPEVDRKLFRVDSPPAPDEAEAAVLALVARRRAVETPTASPREVVPPPDLAPTPEPEVKTEAEKPKAPRGRRRIAAAQDDVTLRDLAAVEASLPEVTWLWEGWLPRGLVTVLAAAPGEGKSGLALEIARRAMGAAATWPDGRSTDAGDTVVLVDTEAAEAILRGRVREWGIPKDRLRVFATDGPSAGLAPMALDDARDWKRLASAVMETRPALVVVDSLSGGHRLDENRSELRHLLMKFAHLARDSQSAFLAVHHLRKRSPGESAIVTLDLLRGSGTLGQLARCVWAVDRPDPADARRRLSQIKNNLAPFPAPIGFTIGPTGLTFTDAPVRPRPLTRAAKAEEFLRILLSEGPVAAAAVYREGATEGLPRMTLWRDAETLGVAHIRDGHLGAFRWSLPGEVAPEQAQS